MNKWEDKTYYIWSSARSPVGQSVEASMWISVKLPIWKSASRSVMNPVWDSARSSIYNSMEQIRFDVKKWKAMGSLGDPMWSSVWSSVGISIKRSMFSSVRDFIWDSVGFSMNDVLC